MNIFDSILIKKPKRSLFNLSHEYKFTGNMGRLYPILCQEVVPGDTWKVNSEILVRFSPLLAPIMHRVNVKINYFFVPNRLIWDDWETFITGGEKGTEFPVRPFISIDDDEVGECLFDGSLADYLGFPTSNGTSVGDQKVNALPFRAYWTIWNEWYRNQNVQDEVEVLHNSGENSIFDTDYFKVARRNWEKDYFTSALPFVQRGNPVSIPIDGGNVAISYTLPTPADIAAGKTTHLVQIAGADVEETPAVIVGTTYQDGQYYLNDAESQSHVYDVDNSARLNGTISSVNGTINDLRYAYRLQRWLENNARAGSRYIEQILSHFGVKSPDARLQRSEYLGGYTCPVVISEVLQNSASVEDGTPQANMAGHGMALDKTHYVKRFFPEHGWIIGLLSVMPRTSYQQGMPRQFMRNNRYDYYFPEFANLGEQEITRGEVFHDFAAENNNDQVFGYQQRFAEMRYIPSTVHGEFKNSLSFWHLGRIFDEQPTTINGKFVSTEDVRTDVFAVSDEDVSDKLWIEVYNNIRAVRPLPKYAIPTL